MEATREASWRDGKLESSERASLSTMRAGRRQRGRLGGSSTARLVRSRVRSQYAHLDHMVRHFCPELVDALVDVAEGVGLESGLWLVEEREQACERAPVRSIHS